MCQQFKAHQEQDGGNSYLLNFFATGRIVINAKMSKSAYIANRTYRFCWQFAIMLV